MQELTGALMGLNQEHLSNVLCILVLPLTLTLTLSIVLLMEWETGQMIQKDAKFRMVMPRMKKLFILMSMQLGSVMMIGILFANHRPRRTINLFWMDTNTSLERWLMHLTV